MKGDDRDFSDAIDAGVWPRTRRQIGYGANVQVVTERGLGSFSRLGGLTGKSEDDFVDEFGASEPVQVRDSPQYCRGKRQVIIHEATDGCAMERIVAKCPGNGASDRPPANDEDLTRLCIAPPPVPHNLPQSAQQREPGQAAGKYSNGGERMHSVPRSDEHQADRQQR